MFKMIARALALAGLTALMTAAAYAQNFPSKPIKIVLGFGVGGGADAIARLYAAKLQEVLHTPVIVDNKPSAYELVAGQTVVSAQPDGYTLWLVTTGGVVQAPLLRSMPYDPLKSFTHVGVIAEADSVLLVKKGLHVKTVDELIKYAKDYPNKINFGSAGTGAPSHLLVEYIQSLTNTKMTHIPYKSAGDVVRELAAGTIDFAVAVPASAAPLVNNGKINAIAVNGPNRLSSLPNVPTLDEGNIQELKNMSVYAFYAILGPAGMPPAITKVLNEAFNKVSTMPDVVENAKATSFRPATSTPTELRERIEKESATWSKVAKKIKEVAPLV